MYRTPPRVPNARNPKEIIGSHYELFKRFIETSQHNGGDRYERTRKEFNKWESQLIAEIQEELRGNGYYAESITPNGRISFRIALLSNVDLLMLKNGKHYEKVGRGVLEERKIGEVLKG